MKGVQGKKFSIEQLLETQKNFLDYIDNLMAKEKLDFEGFNVIKNKYKKYKNISITINEN